MTRSEYVECMKKLLKSFPEISWSYKQHEDLWNKIKAFTPRQLDEVLFDLMKKKLKPTPIMIHEKVSKVKKRHMVAAAFPELPKKNECVSPDEIREFREKLRYGNF